MLEELKGNKIHSFAIDSLENIFIVYHSVSDNKLKIAVIVQNEEGKYSTKVINEQPFVEEPIRLLAYRGFLILVTKENYQIYETLPIIEKLQNIKEDWINDLIVFNIRITFLVSSYPDNSQIIFEYLRVYSSLENTKANLAFNCFLLESEIKAAEKKYELINNKVF